MPWRGPEYEGEFPSLGWAIVDLIETYLIAPGGPFAGQPMALTDGQVASYVRWFRLDPTTGRLVYRRGQKRAAKGKGKSPEAAGLAFAELVGDTVPAGWDANGNPVGRPRLSPRVQIAANSEDQTGNTYLALFDMLRDSAAVDDFRLDIGKTRINFRDNRPGVLEPVTSAAESREGEQVTAAVLDESHLWLKRTGGKRLAASIRRNVGKGNGRTWETTNAWAVGEDSVAEETFKAWMGGSPGIYVEFDEAPVVEDLTDRAALRAALEVSYVDAPWVDLDRIVEEIQDPATDPADARRYYLNQLVSGDHQAVDPRRWDALASDADVFDGERIALGFDGSLSEDSTALIACTADGHLFVPVVDGEPTIWERPEGVREWRVPHLAVEDAVAKVMARWSVGRMLCDPPKWTTEIERWAQSWGDETVMFLDTNQPKRMALACDRLTEAVRGEDCTHDGNPVLRAHILACARKKAYLKADEDDGRTRYVWVKADTRKIDAGIAAVLAYEAAMTMPTDEETDISQHIW